MKQAKGTNGMSGEADDDEDFKVVPVESISEYETLQMLSFRSHGAQTTFVFKLIKFSVSASCFAWFVWCLSLR